MPGRSDAREAVLQLLYEDDLNQGEVGGRDEEFLKDRLEGHRELVVFAQGLLEGVRTHREKLDEVLSPRTQNWTLERMAVTDRNSLRLGAFELLHTDTPGPVVVNELVEVAKRYGSGKSAGFVNAILDRLRGDLDQESSPPGSQHPVMDK
jgi:N utilization substance protein B